jgi:hypothetical protein
LAKYDKKVWATIGGEQKVSRVLSFTPLDLVDLLLDLKGLQVIKLGLVGLEFCVKLVLAALFLRSGAITR